MDQVLPGEEEHGAWRQCVWEPPGGNGSPVCPEHWVLAPEPGAARASERMCPQELQGPRQACCLLWGLRTLSFWNV